MKFNDEQLSRILGEHEAGNMRRGGGMLWGSWEERAPVSCCVNQAAFNEPWNGEAKRSRPDSAEWFDINYNPAWTSQEFLTAIEEAGL